MGASVDVIIVSQIVSSEVVVLGERQRLGELQRLVGCVKDILTNYFNTQLTRIYQILEKLGGNQHHFEH
jgi:hypothetical protein